MFRIKTSVALDNLEDPRETLDYAYTQQQELLRKVRQGLVDVATSKQQLDRQAEQLRSRVPQLEDQARRALGADREDLARIALERKQTALGELQGIEQQVTEVAGEQQRLAAAEQQLSAKIEEFRTRRQVLSATYTAAEAQVRLKEALTGVSGEFSDLSMSLGRAEEKIERMRARASALDTLLDAGSLTLPGPGGDSVERELRQLSAAGAVDDELATLKAQLNPPQAPGALPGGREAGDAKP